MKLLADWEVNPDKKHLKDQLSTQMIYNQAGQLQERKTPDKGKQVFIYNLEGLHFFTLQYTQNNEHYFTCSYSYNDLGQLKKTGSVGIDVSREKLQALANVSSVLQSNQIKRPLADSNPLDKVNTMTYPITFRGKQLTIEYAYNKQGLVTDLSIRNQELLDSPIIKFAHNALGQISTSSYFSADNQIQFEQNFKYNSPGFIVEIDSKFLKEQISYTENGYGQTGYFDGSVAETRFEAKWLDERDIGIQLINPEFLEKRLKLKSILAKCLFHYLQQGGCVDHDGRVIAVPSLEELPYYLPLHFNSGNTANSIIEMLDECFVRSYAHQYSYGDHSELTHAKYRAGNTARLAPFNSQSFQIYSDKISLDNSERIWLKLINNFQMLTNNKIYFDKLINQEFYTHFPKNNLVDSLLPNILAKYFSRREFLDLKKFKQLFLMWSSVMPYYPRDTINNYHIKAEEIWSKLKQNNYLYSTNDDCALFTAEFHQIFADEKDFLPEIVGAIQQNLFQQMGQSACDVEAYDIDANGNHRKYYTGFRRYELIYQENSNQISEVSYKSFANSMSQLNFPILHDAMGGIKTAAHKKIIDIVYEPVLNKPILIKMQDGEQIYFEYSVSGERICKRVLNADGNIFKEIMYLRDERGRSLVEKQIIYSENGLSEEQYTAYIYGESGLLCFIRNDEIYHVIKDHEGSTRLVISNDRVVAAYDYLPYGGLMRHYEEKGANLAYRYTGQEWDEEIGLYNFHARFYDPELGRFYQIDPKEQYASPYKYAGNSPVSMVDPDGQEAITFIIIGCMAVGSYLGGAAANNDWNVLRWNFQAVGTWVGVIGGGIGGALAPYGFSASVGALSTWLGVSATTATCLTIGTGLSGMYLNIAVSNRTWDFREFNYQSPCTWNAGFQGAVFGVSIFGGFKGYSFTYKEATKPVQIALVIGSVVCGVALGYVGGASANESYNLAEWRATPGTVFGCISGALCGVMAPLSILGMNSYVNFGSNHLKRSLTGRFMAVGKVMVTAGGTTYLLGSFVHGGWEIYNWDMKSPKMIEATVSGILLAMSLLSSIRASREEAGIRSDIKSHESYDHVSYRGTNSDVAQEYYNNNGRVIYNPPREDCGDQWGAGAYTTPNPALAGEFVRCGGSLFKVYAKKNIMTRGIKYIGIDTQSGIDWLQYPDPKFFLSSPYKAPFFNFFKKTLKMLSFKDIAKEVLGFNEFSYIDAPHSAFGNVPAGSRQFVFSLRKDILDSLRMIPLDYTFVEFMQARLRLQRLDLIAMRPVFHMNTIQSIHTTRYSNSLWSENARNNGGRDINVQSEEAKSCLP